MKRLHPCTGCRHFYGEYVNNRCCNYIFDTGMRRPCLPGKDCTVRQARLGAPHKTPTPAPRQKAKPPVTKPLLTKQCRICGKTFTTTRTKKIYCCDRCREIARSRRKRRRKAAP